MAQREQCIACFCKIDWDGCSCDCHAVVAWDSWTLGAIDLGGEA